MDISTEMVYANPKAYLAGIHNEYFKVSMYVVCLVISYIYEYLYTYTSDVAVLVLDSERCNGVHHIVCLTTIHHGQLPSRIW